MSKAPITLIAKDLEEIERWGKLQVRDDMNLRRNLKLKDDEDITLEWIENSLLSEDRRIEKPILFYRCLKMVENEYKDYYQTVIDADTTKTEEEKKRGNKFRLANAYKRWVDETFTKWMGKMWKSNKILIGTTSKVRSPEELSVDTHNTYKRLMKHRELVELEEKKKEADRIDRKRKRDDERHQKKQEELRAKKEKTDMIWKKLAEEVDKHDDNNKIEGDVDDSSVMGQPYPQSDTECSQLTIMTDKTDSSRVKKPRVEPKKKTPKKVRI